MDLLLYYGASASYPTSIITRIETRISHLNITYTNIFLPHFHYNKDWNGVARHRAMHRDNFLPHFHYNKDWNHKNLELTKLISILLTPLPL